MGFSTEPNWDDGLAVSGPMKSCSCMDTCLEERRTMLQTVHLPPEFGVPLYAGWTQKAEDISFACSSLVPLPCSFFC